MLSKESGVKKPDFSKKLAAVRIPGLIESTPQFIRASRLIFWHEA